MRLPLLTPVLLLLAATTAGAAEQGGAPLETSRKALQELQADQAVKPAAAGSGSKMTDGLPQLQTPLPGATAQDLILPDNRRADGKELKRKKDRQSNWLLEGVGKLGRDAKGRDQSGRDRRRDLPEDEGNKPDSSDPDYMLELYAQQKRAEEEKAEMRQTTKTRTDPIAPFLQEWLGNSPARGKFFDEYVRKPEAGPGQAVPAGATDAGANPGHSMATIEDRRVAAPATPQSNPYLAGFDAASLSEPAVRSVDQSPAAPVAFGGPATTSPVPAIESVPAPRPAEKKPSSSPLSDNEKYFPQQKKF